MRRMIGWGVALVLIGLWIWLSSLGVPYLSFGRDWPLLIVAASALLLYRRVVRRIRRGRSRAQVITDLETGRIDVDRAIEQIRRAR